MSGANEERMAPERRTVVKPERRDGLGSFLGLIVFLAGIALVGATFWQAWDLFSKAPQLNLGIEAGKPIDFGVVGTNFARLLLRVILLVVMAGIGSILANRGARLYSDGRMRTTIVTERERADG